MVFLYAVLSSILFSLHSNSDIPYTTLETAFIQNDASSIAAMGKDKVLLNILGLEGAYSQSQSMLILKDFFSKKPSNSFRFIFKGKESSDGCFAIGSYVSKNENFRITIQFKKINSEYKIESLTIEKS